MLIISGNTGRYQENLIKKLNEIQRLANECLVVLADRNEVREKAKSTEGKQEDSLGNYIVNIVNKIKDCPESERIDKHILDKNTISGRVLLPFFICYKYFSRQGLTTKDIEKITEEFRVKIKLPNISNAVANSLQRYLYGDSTRVKGRAVVYKLNRKGAKYFESLLNPGKDEKE